MCRAVLFLFDLALRRGGGMEVVMGTGIVGVVVLALAFVFLSPSSITLPRPLPLPSAAGLNKGKKNILLVIAHPDDESMFFSPTLLALASMDQYILHVLCLSTGNAEGLGAVRSLEMIKACNIFKISSENVVIKDDPGLQDGFHESWNDELIAKMLKGIVMARNITVIITFDKYGVSGHPNHSSVYHGVCSFLNNVKATDGENTMFIEAWELESANILRKYCGVCDMFLSNIGRLSGNKDSTHYFFNFNLQAVMRAMKQHASQWLWFRRLFVISSRYTYVNILKKIN